MLVKAVLWAFLSTEITEPSAGDNISEEFEETAWAYSPLPDRAPWWWLQSLDLCRTFLKPPHLVEGFGGDLWYTGESSLLKGRGGTGDVPKHCV